MNKQPGRLTLLRDIGSYVGGWLLILKQAGIGFVPPPQVNLPVLIVGGLLVGVPGLAQLITWWASGRTGTPGLPSERPSLPSDSSASSSGTGGEQ